MVAQKNHVLMTLLVIILILLQLLSPIIHAHPVGSSLGQTKGFHLHNDNVESFNINKMPILKMQQLTAQVIGVPSGNKVDELTLLPAVLMLMLYLVYIAINASSHIFYPLSYSKLARRQPRYLKLPLRAPPL